MNTTYALLLKSLVLFFARILLGACAGGLIAINYATWVRPEIVNLALAVPAFIAIILCCVGLFFFFRGPGLRWNLEITKHYGYMLDRRLVRH